MELTAEHKVMDLPLAALGQPAQMADILVQAFQLAGYADDQVVHRDGDSSDIFGMDDESEEKEDVDEEHDTEAIEEEEEEQEKQSDDQAQSNHGRPTRVFATDDTIEADLSVKASALQLAMNVVQELRIRMAIAGEAQIEEQTTDGSTFSSPQPGVAKAPNSEPGNEVHGVPAPNARPQENTQCMSCERSFHAFQRGRHCRSCGFQYCQKCASVHQVLPSSFGFRDEAVRVCDLCTKWFQHALDHYLAMQDLSTAHPGALEIGPLSSSAPIYDALMTTNHRLSMDRASSVSTMSPTAQPTSQQSENQDLPELDIRAGPKRREQSGEHRRRRAMSRRNSLTSTPQSTKSVASVKNKPWLGSHLKAMHVSDRLPRKKKNKDENSADNDAKSPQADLDYRRLRSKSRTKSVDTMEDENWDPVSKNERKSVESKTGKANGEDPLKVNIRAGAKKKTKLARSASFDVTQLHSVARPTFKTSTDDLAQIVESQSSRDDLLLSPSVEFTHKTSSPSRKPSAFDDSDIVDTHVDEDEDEDDQVNADLPSTVLRFAVYKTGPDSVQNFRRPWGVKKKHLVLNRYTLEVDCGDCIVRCKSVFMHRFWSFHCDAVKSITFGSSSGMARLVLSNQQVHDLQFADDDDRAAFKHAVESRRSTSLQSARESLIRPQVRSTLNRTYDASGSGSLPHQASDRAMVVGIDHSSDGSTKTLAHVYWLPGEVQKMDVAFPGTLLIGSSGDTVETSSVWTTVPVMITITNFRLVFMPVDGQHIPLDSGITEDVIAYVPLFAILSTQIVYPEGRRMRARTLTPGFSGVLHITCKDVRTVRVHMTGTASGGEERTNQLKYMISRLADQAQRYFPAPPDQLPRAMSIDSDDTNEEDGNAVEVDSNSSPSMQPVSSNVVRLISGSFAYSYRLEVCSPDLDGWNVFSDEREFKRQLSHDPAALPFFKFYQNKTGNICGTYPSKLLVPSGTTSAELRKVADFRSKRRIPVVTYFHRSNRCVLVRSSQPLMGNLISGSSNLSDQLLVGVYRRMPDIVKTQSTSAASSNPIYIFDARKQQASTGNRIIGHGGVETPADYPHALVFHLNISNMYRMQASFQQLVKLVMPGGVGDHDRTFWSNVENTRWLDHVRLVLDGALKIARALELEGASTLVHCSDGWDRTSQLVSLAQLMIDPYYRTIKGFIVLVEKDWAAFGHKFAERLGGERNKDSQQKKASPVMFQFLDAVWQILRQFPDAFEFNEAFLLHLADALSSGLYGTFLYNSRLERDVNDVQRKTTSVWTPVLLSPTEYSNPMYDSVDGPVWPWVSCQSIRLWDSYFFQWHPKYGGGKASAETLGHGLNSADNSLSDDVTQ